MATPRKKQVILSQTRYYHCMSRCVRQAFLCGKDYATGRNYEHRRSWIEERILMLTRLFTIDVCSYAIMHNHTHLVVFVDDVRVQTLTGREVLRRWGTIHSLPIEAIHYIQHGADDLSEFEIASVDKLIIKCRKSLCCISTFMKDLNQQIAIKANKEDNCKGKFWEARFKSQALLDIRALIACMVYVDLNPLRVGAANSLSTSEYTSIRKRIIEAKIGKQPFEVLPFQLKNGSLKNTIPIDLFSYLELVAQTANSIGLNNKNVVSLPLAKLGISAETWAELCLNFEKVFGYVAGGRESLDLYKQKLKQKKIRGITNAIRLLK